MASKSNYHPDILFDPGYGTYAVSQNVTNHNSLTNSPFHPQSNKQPIEPSIQKKINLEQE